MPIFKNIAMKNIFPKSFGQANKSLGTIGQVAGGLQMLTGMAGQASKYMDTSGITQQGSEYEDITRGNIGQSIDIQQDQTSFGTIATDAASSAVSGMATFGPLGAIAGLAPIITGILGNDAKKKAWNDTMNSERSLRMTKQRQFNEQDLRTGMANQFAYGGDIKNSVSDLMGSLNMDNSFAARKQFATANGIKNYRGTAQQNIQLMRLINNQQAQLKAKQQPRATAQTKGMNVNPLPVESTRMSQQQRFDKQTVADKRRLQSGVVIDKRSNKAYIVQNGKAVSSHPVLTGGNVEGNYSKSSLKQKNENFEDRVTPTGFYNMIPQSIYNQPGMVLQPINAFGYAAPVASDQSTVLAHHVTYNPAKRDALYDQDPSCRNASMGCINHRPGDLNNLISKFPNGDTTMVVDSNNPIDKNFIQNMNPQNRFAYGGQFDSPLTEFNTGGTHEQNPNNGIMQGMGSNGQPNLVEEGETKYNDYIYSNRLSIDDSIVKAYNLPTKVKGKTFAEATKILNEQVKERPNDPISLKTLEANMSKLAQAQDDLKATIEQDAGVNEAIDNLGFSEEIFAKGGSLNFKSNAAYKKWLGYVHATGKAESTPRHQSVSIKGKSHEVKHQLGGALYSELDALKNSGIFAYGGNMYATRGQLDLPETSVGDGDEIAKEINLNEITIAPKKPYKKERIGFSKAVAPEAFRSLRSSISKEDLLERVQVDGGSDNNSQLNYAMFAPIFANAMQGISTAFEKPAVEKYGRVAPELITSRMSYRPLSTEYLSNQIQSQGAGLRRYIQDSAKSAGSAMRGILEANRNTSDALSQAYFQAEAAREARRAAVESGNIGIQGQNVASKNAAASQNAQIRMAEVIANMQNRAARNNALRGFAATMGNDLGQIGRMMYASKTGQAMTGYDTDPFSTDEVKYKQ